MTGMALRPRGFAWSLLVIVFAATAAPALAALDRWQPYPPDVGGPWGGSVRRIVSPGDPGDPTDPLWAVLWAATDGGVYVSENAGASWERRSQGLESFDVQDVAVCASDPQRLIAATRSTGVYLSADGGGQ